MPRSSREAQLRGGRRLAGSDRAAGRRRRLSAHAAMVRPASDRIGLRAGKPIYCLAVGLGEPEMRTDRPNHHRFACSFHAEFARRFYPVTLRLRTLLASTLGAAAFDPRTFAAVRFRPLRPSRPDHANDPAPLIVDPGSYLLDSCCFLFGTAPRSVQRVAGNVLPDAQESNHGGPDFESFTFTFENGGNVQISLGRYHRGA